MTQPPEPVTTTKGIILVGHGAIAKDCPRDLVIQLKALEGRRQATGEAPNEEERALDQRIRQWPRSPETDPYQVGLEALADALRPRMPEHRLDIAYLEFCAPTLEAAVADITEDGIDDIVIVPSMLTPGGAHSEIDIPVLIDALRQTYPAVSLRYAWPVNLDLISSLLASHLHKFFETSAAHANSP